MRPTIEPTDSGKSRRSEAFWLALAIAVIHAGLITVLIVVAWRSPFFLFRLPEKAPPPIQTGKPTETM